MKILYHGSDSIIETPEIREANRTLDFGTGFYLTSSKSQGGNWVRRKLERDNLTSGYISIYHFCEEDAAEILNIKVFDSPSGEWLDFVMANRRIPNFKHDYDVVIGPVANDRVYTAFALYEGGSISKDTLIHELKPTVW